MIGGALTRLAAAFAMTFAAPGIGLAADGTIVAELARGCAACHGADGAAHDEIGVPRLAGLPAAYIARQLEAYAADTRANAVMRGPARELDGAAIAGLAAYYAAMKPQPRAPRDDRKLAEAEIAEGERLALRGDWAKGVPPCASCHGRKGLGVGEAFPPLAGQGAGYLDAQLAAWKAGTRHDDPDGLMRGVAARLEPAQAAAVAAYYAAANPTLPEGQTR